jgi:hypothetical protein
VTLLPDADRRALRRARREGPRVRLVRIVGSEAALDRFRRAYPDLGAALAELRERRSRRRSRSRCARRAARDAQEIAGATRLWPASSRSRRPRSSSRAVPRRGRPGAQRRLYRRGADGGRVLSVASAVRLALDLHRDEVGIMRLMGATEGRDPRAVLALRDVEGLIGGSIALGLLYGTYRLALWWLTRDPHPVLSVFWVGFLGLPAALLLPAFGAAAGLTGSLLSLGGGKSRRLTRIA